MKTKIASRFQGIEGGLFSSVSKADVGDSFASMAGKVVLMGWADPFYPDPSLPENVKQALIGSIESGFASHYTMPIGSPELKEEIAKKLKRQNGLDVDPRRNILITPGSDSGLFYAMSIFLNPGDEVLIPDPSYPNNFQNVQLLSCRGVPVPLRADENYALDVDAFERAVTERTKMVVLTHPNNPTATVFTRENLQALADFIIRHDLILVVDQAFEDIVFDDAEFVTPASLPGMWERTVSVFSISKGFGLSGLRVGYLVASDVFMDIYFGAAVSVIGATNTASQAAAIEVFRNHDFMDRYYRHYDRRRKDAVRILGAVPGVKISLPESGFFCWIDVSALGDSTDVMNYLIREAGVAVNDGKNYGAQGAGHLRIINGCLGSDDESEQALMRIADALRRYKKETT